MNEPLLRMTRISKAFPGVQALSGVDFDLSAGETHVLMGENGAGKSTLMKILAGIYTADSGTVRLSGREVSVSSPGEALALGVSMIHQELNPIPDMTVAENIFVGREPVRLFGLLDKRALDRQTRELGERLGIDLEPGRKLRRLSVAEAQMVEIAKAVSWDTRIVIMDEPTSALTNTEVDKLFGIIDTLKRGGVGVVYISHKMDEIFRVADRITVFRDGRHVLTAPASELNPPALIQAMVGREIADIYPRRTPTPGRVALEAKAIASPDAFADISFAVRYGEVFGLAGLMGSGRTEVAETLFGIRPLSAGCVEVDGRPADIPDPGGAAGWGLALVHEDRKGVGLNLKASVKDNMTLPCLASFCRLGVVRARAEREAVAGMIEALRIKTPSQRQIVNHLSGGNQQKVVLSKWLMAEPSVLILDEPTRGIDVGAKAEIYALIAELAAKGKAILFISSELPEIVGLCDRVLVMHEGRSMGVVEKRDISQEHIMRLATAQCRVAAG